MSSMHSSSSGSAGYIDNDIIRATQAALNGVISRPALTPKLLSRPPFRFLHDVVTSVIAATGFGSSLYSGDELNRDMVGREAKIAFLKKVVDLVQLTLSSEVSLRPARVVAGLDPKETNKFLQQLAAASTSTKYVENVAATNTVLGERLDLSDDDVLVTSSVGPSSVQSPSRRAAASSGHRVERKRDDRSKVSREQQPRSPFDRTSSSTANVTSVSALPRTSFGVEVDTIVVEDSRGASSRSEKKTRSTKKERPSSASVSRSSPKRRQGDSFGTPKRGSQRSVSRDSNYRSVADISSAAGATDPGIQTYKNGWWECRVARGEGKCVALLKRQLALDVSQTNQDGWTPLHIAAKCDHPDCITELIFRGTYVNVPDNIGRTPLHIAASSGAMKAMAELISNGAMLDAVNSYGDTPLHLACRYGKANAVRELVSEGAEIFTRNNANQNPHDCASEATVRVMKNAVMYRHAEMNQLVFDTDGIDTEAELQKAETVRTRQRGQRAAGAWIPAGVVHDKVTRTFDIPLQ